MWSLYLYYTRFTYILPSWCTSYLLTWFSTGTYSILYYSCFLFIADYVLFPLVASLLRCWCIHDWNWYDRVPLWFIMTYVFLIRQIHTTIFGTTMYFQYTIVLTIIVLHASSYYNSSSGIFVWTIQTFWNTHQTLSTKQQKLQAIHTTIKYTTRYSQLGKPQDPRTNQGW
jgi:hypothetical protein